MKTEKQYLEEINAVECAGDYNRQQQALQITEEALDHFPESQGLQEMESWLYENLSEISVGC
jgi:hypothetical protein